MELFTLKSTKEFGIKEQSGGKLVEKCLRIKSHKCEMNFSESN
jgi:hypothetical protein